LGAPGAAALRKKNRALDNGVPFGVTGFNKKRIGHQHWSEDRKLNAMLAVLSRCERHFFLGDWPLKNDG